ncbi:MAG: hypothetical protein CVU51_13230 [Deltaproteobacteria bacterium HGW-Deltaproteobacteria-1]|nr:MAG: hypothetical protein CVU51_13230 [Deltaproteobacteria bacterium HGW-Deltaproteobacteria-1]
MNIEFNELAFFVNRRHAHLFLVHGINEHNMFHNSPFRLLPVLRAHGRDLMPCRHANLKGATLYIY